MTSLTNSQQQKFAQEFFQANENFILIKIYNEKKNKYICTHNTKMKIA